MRARERGGEGRSSRCRFSWKAASIFNASHDKALCVCQCMCVRVSVRVSVSNCLSQSDKKAPRDEGEAWLFWGL